MIERCDIRNLVVNIDSLRVVRQVVSFQNTTTTTLLVCQCKKTRIWIRNDDHKKEKEEKVMQTLFVLLLGLQTWSKQEILRQAIEGHAMGRNSTSSGKSLKRSEQQLMIMDSLRSLS